MTVLRRFWMGSLVLAAWCLVTDDGLPAETPPGDGTVVKSVLGFGDWARTCSSRTAGTP